MSGVTSFTIELERPSGVYFAGETVTGRVTFVSTKYIETRGVHISYKCTGHSHYTVESTDSEGHTSVTIYNGEKKYEEYRCTLLGSYYNHPGPVVERTTLPAGTFERAFAFPVRIGAIGSAEIAQLGGEHAAIRYFLNAFVDLGKKNEPSEGRTDPSVSVYITVLPSRPLPPPELLCAIEYMRNFPKQIPYSCCLPCFSKGDITLNAKLARQAFAPGEPLDFFLRVNNNCDFVLDLQVELVCSVLLQGVTSFFFHAGSVDRSTRRNAQSLLRCFIDPRAISEISYDSTKNASGVTHVGAGGPNPSCMCMRKVVTVPTVPPSFCGVAHAAGADPVTFTYNIVFSVRTFGTKSSISFPVVICAAPPSASALQAARAQPARQLVSPKGSGSLQYDMNFVPETGDYERVPVPTVVSLGPVTKTTYPASISMFSRPATVTSQHTSYGITYTASDLANALPSAPAMPVQATESRAEPAPMPTATVTGDHVTALSSVVRHDEEDAGIELGKDTLSSGGYKAVASTAPVATSSTMDRSTNLTEDPVASLVESLRSSADLRATVRAWAASTNIRAVHALSPKDLQRILQSVSISSDQAVVASELAQAIHCTCAHVTSALAVCQFFKTEVALAMVPHVRDAENKAQVLNLLPSYDQKKVEALFVK